jgi:hypothetical protein
VAILAYSLGSIASFEALCEKGGYAQVGEEIRHAGSSGVFYGALCFKARESAAKFSRWTARPF